MSNIAKIQYPKSLNLIIQKLLDKKSFRIDLQDKAASVLCKNGYFIRCNNCYEMIPSFVTTRALLDGLKEKGDFIFSKTAKDWEKQEKKLFSWSEWHRYVPFYYGTAISYIIEETDGSISFNKNSNDVEWLDGLKTLLPFEDWAATFFHNILLSFKIKEKESDNYLSYCIQLYCKNSFENGLDLLKLMPDKKTECLSGLMMNDFKRACELYGPNNNNELFVNAFNQTTNLCNEDVCFVFDLMHFNGLSDDNKLAFLFKVLTYLDDTRASICKDQIRSILETPDKNDINIIYNWLLSQKGLNAFAEECILLFVGHLAEPSKDLPILDEALYYKHLNTQLFGNITTLISDIYDPDSVLLMKRCLDELYRKNENDFINLTLCFIIHPKGKYRITGRQLWDSYHLDSSDFDPLALDEKQQIVFALFMLQDWGNPETRLSKVLPLFLSKSEKVRSILMSQMKEYTDNYMGHVTLAIERLGLDTEETKQIKNYVYERQKYIEKRRELKELSPLYSCYDIYREALRTKNDYEREHLNNIESENKPMFMNLFKKQVLARGGGWRKKNGKTQHLAKFEVSIPTNIMIQSMTPFEREKWLTKLYEDYDVEKGNC